MKTLMLALWDSPHAKEDCPKALSTVKSFVRASQIDPGRVVGPASPGRKSSRGLLEFFLENGSH